jgi:hypothetical protein
MGEGGMRVKSWMRSWLVVLKEYLKKRIVFLEKKKVGYKNGDVIFTFITPQLTLHCIYRI